MINILTQILIEFWSNLDRSWVDFGFHVGAKLEPNAYKIRPQNQSKKVLRFYRLFLACIYLLLLASYIYIYLNLYLYLYLHLYLSISIALSMTNVLHLYLYL